MKKFILTIVLNLYVSNSIASPIDDLYTKYIYPEIFTVEQAQHLYEFTNSENITYNSYYISNAKALIQYTGGMVDGVGILFQSFPIVSEFEVNCLTRPTRMFMDEIFKRYKNGEIAKDDNYRIMLFMQIMRCIQGMKFKYEK